MPVTPVLLLDNKDSFVWNLAQALQVLGHAVMVERSDRFTVPQVAALRPLALVLSPGPGRPCDAGICVEAVRALSPTLPILGVCLGHQAIAAAFGAQVERGAPCHGKATPIHHPGTGLFRGLPSPLQGCRYHSLEVDTDSLPDVLHADAFSPDGVLMAVHHRERPTFGVQFHPESFRTEHGLELLRNFTELAS